MGSPVTHKSKSPCYVQASVKKKEKDEEGLKTTDIVYNFVALHGFSLVFAEGFIPTHQFCSFRVFQSPLVITSGSS